MRRKVLYLFKELLYVGRDYPIEYTTFRAKLKGAFRAKKGLQDPEEIKRALAHGEYIKNEIIALHQLRTYRAVKRNYNY